MPAGCLRRSEGRLGPSPGVLAAGGRDARAHQGRRETRASPRATVARPVALTVTEALQLARIAWEFNRGE